MDRVFLDANILFSAAWRRGSGLAVLWRLADVELVTSQYAIREATENLPDRVRRRRLQSLLRSVRVVSESVAGILPARIELPEQDKPIHAAAVQAGAQFLLTGDKRHFGRFFGRKLLGVTVMPPAQFLERRRR